MPKTRKNKSWITMSNQTRKRKLKTSHKKKEHAVIKKFKKMLDKYPVERQYMHTMISSIPNISGDPRFKRHPKSLDELFKNLNSVLTEAPKFNKTALVGTPLPQ